MSEFALLVEHSTETVFYLIPQAQLTDPDRSLLGRLHGTDLDNDGQTEDKQAYERMMWRFVDCGGDVIYLPRGGTVTLVCQLFVTT